MKPKTKARKPASYIVRYFDVEWNEADDLRTIGSITDALLSASLWAKSRQFDSKDDSLIVFSVYHNYPFISMEECDDKEAQQA